MSVSLFDQENTQFELSYEFLALLKWLAEHEGEQLKKIVVRAVRRGFKPEPPSSKSVDAGFVQESIVNFLELLDTILLEVGQEHRIKKAVEHNLMPAVDRIDAQSCDTDLLQASLDKATQKLEHFPDKNPKELLCAELIKRWKPHKDNALN
jgi:hypothetical protein